MDPVSVIGAATTLLNAVGLGDWLKRKFAGKPSEAAAGAIVDTVVAAAGATDWREANRMVTADLEARTRARELLLTQEHEITRLQFADLDSARRMYAQEHDTADRLARQIMGRNLAAVLVLIGANVAGIYLIKEPTAAVTAGNVIGASIAYLWNERSQVVGFFFGSSIGSKLKDQRKP